MSDCGHAGRLRGKNAAPSGVLRRNSNATKGDLEVESHPFFG